MTSDEAIRIVESRNGIPLEDDWELMEAAQFLSHEVRYLHNLLDSERGTK